MDEDRTHDHEALEAKRTVRERDMRRRLLIDEAIAKRIPHLFIIFVPFIIFLVAVGVLSAGSGPQPSSHPPLAAFLTIALLSGLSFPLWSIAGWPPGLFGHPFIEQRRLSAVEKYIEGHRRYYLRWSRWLLPVAIGWVTVLFVAGLVIDILSDTVGQLATMSLVMTGSSSAVGLIYVGRLGRIGHRRECRRCGFPYREPRLRCQDCGTELTVLDRIRLVPTKRWNAFTGTGVALIAALLFWITIVGLVS